MADDYQTTMGILTGLNQGLRGYMDARNAREQRQLEMAARGLVEQDGKFVQDPVAVAREKAKNIRESTLKMMDMGVIPKAGDLDEDGNINLFSLQGRDIMGNKALQREKGLLEMQKLRQELSQGSFTPGEKTADTEFAKEYNRYVNEGGFAATESGINKLKKAAEEIKTKKLTGGITGFLPKAAQDYFNPELGAARDKIQSAIQSSLKTVLDSQFAAREAEAVMERSFNPRLSPEENYNRVMEEAEKIKQKAMATESAGKYFQANKGSLRGYQGMGLLPSGGQTAGPTPSAPPTQPDSGGLINSIQPKATAERWGPEDQQAIQWAKSNPNDPRAQQILKIHGVK